MGSMVAGVELFDRQVVNSDELDVEVDQVLRAVGSEVCIVLHELLLRQQSGISRANEDSLMTLDVVLTQFRGADRENLVAEAHEQCWSDQTLQRNLVHRLAIVEKVTCGIDVSAGVGAESYRGDIGAGAFGNRLLQGDIDLGI